MGRRVRCYGWPLGSFGTYPAWGKVRGPLRIHWVEAHDARRPGIRSSLGSVDRRRSRTGNEIVSIVAADRDPARRLSYLVQATPAGLSWKHWNRPPQQLPSSSSLTKGWRHSGKPAASSARCVHRELVRRTAARPVTLVVGASGSGKSSECSPD
jgi:hypothetical protein